MIEAVRTASKIARTVSAALAAADSVTKVDKSPVTVADLAAQIVVSQRLRAIAPSIPLVGEEDSEILAGDDARVLRDAVFSHARTAWPQATDCELLAALDRGGDGGGATGAFFTLDPIDGTKGFLRGGQYAVALALIVDGRVAAGVLGCPNFSVAGADCGGTLFYAVRGGGAFAERVDGGRATSIHASSETNVAHLRLAESVESAHSDRGASGDLRSRLGVTVDPVRMDSQCKYALLASGLAEVYLRTPTDPTRSEWIWDHAAGVIVLEEAGGRVTDLDGRALDFSRGRKLTANRGIAATNGRVHDALLAALR